MRDLVRARKLEAPVTKSFPRPRRRAADDAALVDLLRDSPWERAMRECQTSEQATPFEALDRVGHEETRRAG
jgi:hypothetical protein